MSRIWSLLSFACLVTFVGLFTGCGSTGNTSTAGNPGASSGSSSSGSGSSGPALGSGGSSGSSGSSGSGSGSGSSSDFVSFAYTASASEIRAYGVNSDGSLTAVSGSPFAFSTALGENIVTNGSNLYASDTSNSNIDIFSINRSTGSLSMAGTAGALTGASASMYTVGLALDHTGSSLYVSLGLAAQNSGINLFAVGSAPTAQETKFLDTGAYAEPALVFSPNNQFAYSDLCTAKVDGVFGYARASDGTLTNLNLAFAPGPTGITGVGFCPGPIAVSAKGFMAIVWLPDALGSSVPSNQPYLITYTINSDGTLTEVSNSQVPTGSSSSIGAGSSNTIRVSFDPSGSVLAVAGTAGVQTFSLNGNGMLTPVGTALNAGVSFQSIAWDTSNHLFATSSSQLFVYNSNSGVLTPAGGSPNVGDSELAVLPPQ